MPRTRSADIATIKSPTRRQPPRCNALDGRRWLQNSISVWSDLRKSAEERRLKHPAQFPVALVERLIESFLPDGAHTVLDPFCGSGSTLLAARHRGKYSVGIELSAEYVELARRRLSERNGPSAVVHHAPVSRLSELVPQDSIDLCVTSPPYWNILNQKRTADSKAIRHYGNLAGDLSQIANYEAYLQALTDVFQSVWSTLRSGAHCGIVVMDLRKQDRFFPLHSDLAGRLQQIGYRWDDLIVWNRQAEYNHLRPLGYPAVFRINKVHEFILLMQKPKRQ
jgi:DNA modification methylase